MLIVTYRPPQGKIEECTRSLRELLSSIDLGLEVFLLGDLNINYKDTNLKAVKELKALEKEYNLKQQIIYPTRVTTTTETLLEHIHSNATNIMQKGIIDNHLSDHYPIYLTIKKQPTTYEHVTFTYRMMKNLDEKDLEQRIQQIDWSNYYTLESPAECWEFIYNALIEIMDELCPEKTMTNVKKKTEWLTSNIFELMKA